MTSDRLLRLAADGEDETMLYIQKTMGGTPVLRLMKFALMALLAAILVTPAVARAPEWVELGTHKVKLLETDDEIQVGRDDGVFTRIRLEVSGNDVDIRDMRVRFINGEEQVIRIDQNIREGRSTPDYDLTGRRRGIQSIFLRYNGRPIFGGNSRIRLMAERADFDPPPPPPLAGRPVILGSQIINAASDRIEFNIGRQDGPVSQIRLRAVDGPILYRAVEITFGNGQTQVIEGIERLEPGEQGKAIDLEGDRRNIQKVVVFKRPSWRQGESKVELLGLVQPRPAPPPPPPPPRPLPPVAGGYETIDLQSVDKASDRIDFRPRRPVPAEELSIRALDEPLTFRNVTVAFTDGTSQSFDFIERLEPGQESRPIDLRGNRKLVSEVTVQKRPSWRPGVGRAELLAKIAPPPPPPPRPRPTPGPSAGDFDVIDQQIVDRRSDKVTLIVDRNEGPFSKIKFKALDDGILFNHIQIVFRDGRTQEIDIIERLEPGEESPAIDVEGRGDIDKVIVTKRPSWRAGESRLQLAGLERPRAPPPPPPRPSGPPSHGFPPGWVLIGEGDLAPGKSPPPRPFNPACFANRNLPGCDMKPLGALPSRVILPVGRDVGQFRRIGFRLIGGDLQIQGITIVYGTGERDSVQVGAALTNNARTQPIELRGERFIREIEIDYVKSTLNRSTLEVYGDYVDSWLGDRGHRRDYNQGWVMLGSQRAQMFSSDVDAFQVGQRFGAFRSVKFVVRRHAVRFYGLRIVYGDGQVEDVPFSGELTDGQSTPPLNLTGRGQRYIDRIEFKYRTKLNFQGEGVVEVWGQQ